MKTTIKRIRQLIREALRGSAVPASNPDPGCPECRGTGLYTGLSTVETCRTCSTPREKPVSKLYDPNKKSYDGTSFPSLPPVKPHFLRYVQVISGGKDLEVWDVEPGGMVKQKQMNIDLDYYFPGLKDIDQPDMQAVCDWIADFADANMIDIKDADHPSGMFMHPDEWRKWVTT